MLEEVVGAHRASIPTRLAQMIDDGSWLFKHFGTYSNQHTLVNEVTVVIAN